MQYVPIILVKYEMAKLQFEKVRHGEKYMLSLINYNLAVCSEHFFHVTVHLRFLFNGY